MNTDIFSSVSLEQISSVSLLDRRDTKFILHRSALSSLLERLANMYQVLEIDGIREFRYQTLYFDTPDLRCYHEHHNGREKRYKIRTRSYLDTGIHFNEVKCRSRCGTVQKHRASRREEPSELITDDFGRMIREKTGIDPSELTLSAEILYNRTTLIDLSRGIRFTVDSGLEAVNQFGRVHFPGLIIAEMKTAVGESRIEALRELKQLGVVPANCSKYCISTASLNRSVKKNMFAPHLRKIAKITEKPL